MCGAGTSVCRTGERLFFRVGASPVRRWLAAYAEPVDVADPSQRIWMFPGGDQSTPEIPVSMAPSILSSAVDLASGMAPGRYRVTMILFDHPPTRGEASDARGGIARTTSSLVVQ
jgi:hypothetical protein